MNSSDDIYGHGSLSVSVTLAGPRPTMPGTHENHDPIQAGALYFSIRFSFSACSVFFYMYRVWYEQVNEFWDGVSFRTLLPLPEGVSGRGSPVRLAAVCLEADVLVAVILDL